MSLPRLIVCLFLISFFWPHLIFAETSAIDPNPKRILTEITKRGQVMKNLKELTSIGPRMSGSAQAEKAVEWVKKKMESYGFDRIRLQAVEVPKWERGNHEQATISLPDGKSVDLKTAALGGSVGTPPEGVQATVVEIHSFEELEKRGNALKGKIVFYNVPMDLLVTDKFLAYEHAVPFRTQGASKAAQFGAVATVLRSLSTLPDDDHPHTGMIHYKEDFPKIPTAALSTHAANVLSDLLKKNPDLRLKIELSASGMKKANSFNVIGQITGSEFSKDVFVVGGHLDSWDLGVGAQDDGAGVVQSLEVLRVMKSLGIQPKRTIRMVAFMTEELGGIGGEVFAKESLASSDHFIGAMESDRGGFKPTGFTVHASAAVQQKVETWKPYLASMKADHFFLSSDGGTDTRGFGKAGVPEFEIVPESTHYFDFHHSALDQLSAVNADDLKMAAASMAVFIYLATEQGL